MAVEIKDLSEQLRVFSIEQAKLTVLVELADKEKKLMIDKNYE